MSTRLTKKTKLNNLDGGKLYKINADYSKCEDLDDKKMVCAKATSKIIDKLGQLEDLEEEYGIDLVLVSNVLKNGFYYRSPYFHDKVEFFPDSFKHFSGIMRNENGLAMVFGKSGVVYFKDYGTGWALTKEELQ